MKQVASKNKNPKGLPVSWDPMMKHSLITRSLIPSTNSQNRVAYPNLRALEDFTTEIEESKRSERNKFTPTPTRKGQTALIKCFRYLSIMISSKWKRNTWEWNLATSGSITRLKLSKTYRNPSKNKVFIFSPTFPQIDHQNKANGPNFQTIKSHSPTKYKRKQPSMTPKNSQDKSFAETTRPPSATLSSTLSSIIATFDLSHFFIIMIFIACYISSFNHKIFGKDNNTFC
jgi:hypothetical protein